MTIKKLKEELLKERQKVLECNINNFDLVVRSYLQEIKNHPENQQGLTARLYQEVKKLQQKKLNMIPPALCQFSTETGRQWLERCYSVGGYGLV